MKKIVFLAIFLFSYIIPIYPQLTSVSATITDSDSTIWTNAQWKVQFVPNPSQPNPCIYNIDNVSLCTGPYNTYTSQSGISNGSGVFSVTLIDNTQISPSGSQWVFTIQSNTSAPATQYLPLTISGSTMNLSTYLSINSIAPRIKIGNLAGIYAYADIEITNQTCGNFYWNVVASQTRQWNCNSLAWQTLVTSSWNGGTVLNPIQAPSYTCTGSPNPCYTGALTGNVIGNVNGNATTSTTATHALNLPADLATQSAASPNTASFTTLTPTVRIADWYDTTGSCHLYRGIVNVKDCGAVADGTFTTNGCGSGNNCWVSTGNVSVANNTAIRAAITAASAAGTTGGTVVFPPSGTNVWMVGGTGGCSQTSGDGSMNTIFTIPNNVTITGSGSNSTVIMVSPNTAPASNCVLFSNSQEPAYGIQVTNLRLDGNQLTDSIHNDTLHPNNNNSTANLLDGAYYIAPGTISNPGVLDIPAIKVENTQITGFPGVNPGESGTYPNITQFVIWTGGYGFVNFTNNSIYFNQWAGAIFSQTSDSLWLKNYFVQNGNWDEVPTAVEWNNGGSRWESNYFGGGFATNFIGFGVFGDYIANNINDFPGPGNTVNCGLGASGCGENWQFVDGFSGSARYCMNNILVNNGASDTYPGYPAISFEGHSTNNSIIGMGFYNISGGTVPTYLVQEKNSATYTTIINPVVTETPSTSNWSFTDSNKSYALGSNGIKDTYASTNLSDSNTIVHTGTPTVNQATCVKSAGPPIVIGYCSTVVGAGGACTCN